MKIITNKDYVVFDNYWCKPPPTNNIKGIFNKFSISVFFKYSVGDNEKFEQNDKNDKYSNCVWVYGQYSYETQAWSINGKLRSEEEISDERVVCWFIPPDAVEEHERK
jgi:hypothetical protein